MAVDRRHKEAGLSLNHREEIYKDFQAAVYTEKEELERLEASFAA